ncbi:MAG: cytidylate kinase-like family protein [Deltaproteobacteria bacterium]|nr:cytidylate kinase-like family protein [Deltaproteobacteria bacterium]
MSLITVSYGIGSDGLEIAKRVSKALGLELFDDDRLKEEAVRMGIRPDEVKTFDEKLPGFFERIRSYRPELYVDLLEAVIYEVAKKGTGIIVGHGSNVLLRDFDCALHVLVYDSETSRINRLVADQGFSRDAAENLIRKRDKERRGFLQYAFHVDWDDPGMYDLVVNRQKVGQETAAKLIIETAKSPELLECGLKAVDTMERLMLTKKVEAKIIEDGVNTDLLHIEVPEKGKVYIRGLARTEDEKARLKGLLEGMEEILELEFEVSVVPAGAE